MSAPAVLASISQSALAANAGSAAARARPTPVADLRRDAFGHGIAVVAAVLAEAGVRMARTDGAGREPARRAGIQAVDAEPTLDSGMLYGFPGSGGTPVMRLSGTVLSTKRLLEGEGVSYNYTHRAERDTRIALLAGGFGQGIVRGLGNRVFVAAGSRRFPIVGRVAMDVCVIDIGDAPVRPGDEVVFFGGEGLARDALADWKRATGLTPAELTCAIGLRVRQEDAA